MRSRFGNLFVALSLITVLNFSISPLRAGAVTAPDVSSSALLAATNEQRALNGLVPLSFNYQLTNAAQAKANDMVANNYWSHVSPSGVQPWDFVSQSGYNFKAAGENLASGFDSLSAVIIGWMNSPTHRANLLSTTYSEVGFGIANASNFTGTGPQTIVVAEYGLPANAPPPVAVNSTPEPEPTPVAAIPEASPAVESIAPPVAVESVSEPPKPSTAVAPSTLKITEIAEPDREINNQQPVAETSMDTPVVALSIIAFGLFFPLLFAYRKRLHFDLPQQSYMDYIVY